MQFPLPSNKRNQNNKVDYKHGHIGDKKAEKQGVGGNFQGYYAFGTLI